jgi:3D (Asp-Asp-Asp) domain-containing protein
VRGPLEVSALGSRLRLLRRVLRRRLRRRYRRAGAMAILAVIALGAVAGREPRPSRLQPIVVESPVQLAGAIVRGITPESPITAENARLGKPIPVELTAYCLSGTTRRGRYVRAGIVAADPRYFPLSRYIEVYVGTEYLGRFLVDDTGRLIIGRRLDIWMDNCKDARRFGRRKGIAVLVVRDPARLAPTPPPTLRAP